MNIDGATTAIAQMAKTTTATAATPQNNATTVTKPSSEYFTIKGSASATLVGVYSPPAPTGSGADEATAAGNAANSAAKID